MQKHFMSRLSFIIILTVENSAVEEGPNLWMFWRRLLESGVSLSTCVHRMHVCVESLCAFRDSAVVADIC